MRTAPLLLLLTALSACAPRIIVPVDTLRLSVRASCYYTAQGLVVEAIDGAKCPPQDQVEGWTKDFLRNALGANSESVVGMQVVFVPHEIRCNATATVGCTLSTDDGPSFVTLWPKTADARTVFQHELGHQFLHRQTGSGDPSHSNCVFWTFLDPFGGWCSSLWD